MRALLLAGLPALLLGCSSSSTESPSDAGLSPDSSLGPGGNADAGGSGVQDAGTDAPVKIAIDAGPQDTTCAGACPTSAIKHVVIIVQENHTFDDHFGAYCTAAPGSNPTCNDGPACCEGMPATDPKGTAPTVLTDAEHAQYDPNHTKACETEEMNSGAMDSYSSAADVSGTTCGSAQNVAVADPTIIKPYWDLAAQNAIADRYFQPLVGESSANDMYLARASWVFDDNNDAPKGAEGMTCDLESTPMQYPDKTIGDLLTAASVPWTWFAGGYAAMVAANGSCPPKPTDCAFFLPTYPCAFDPSDIPFEYYASTVDNPATMQDLGVLESILSGTGDSGTAPLPAVSFVKAIGYESEHPGLGTKLSAGVNRVTAIISAIESSRYASDTLVLLTYDEGGGYFDHVTPPGTSPIDNQPYGTRIPLVAVGPFTKTNYVSHVTMEHSSLVKFIEWNWLAGQTGQLGTRDTVVANIGSLLDSTRTGVAVPEN